MKICEKNLNVTYEIKRCVVKKQKKIGNHSKNTCKLKYAYNKLKKPNPVQVTKQYGLELFSTNGTSDVGFHTEFT